MKKENKPTESTHPRMLEGACIIFAKKRRIVCKGPSGYFSRLLAKGMADPTWAHKTIFREVIEPEKAAYGNCFNTSKGSR